MDLKDLINSNNPFLLKGKDFKKLAKQFHPDTGTDGTIEERTEAFQKLNLLNKNLTFGVPCRDDIGKCSYMPDKVRLLEHESFIDRINHKYSTAVELTRSKSFAGYIPKEFDMHNSTWFIPNQKYILSLMHLERPVKQIHVNWIMNRMLALGAFFESKDYSFNGFVLSSGFLLPAEHQVVQTNFYHLCKLGEKPTVSGSYMHCYPSDLIKYKKAIPATDAYCIKRIGAYLLGDDMMIGTTLRKSKDVHPRILEFILKEPSSTYKAWEEYNKILVDNFENKFYHF